ncbi:phosphotransferase [Mycoplasmopsis lipofaciens]|uniref:phosphotransferase n=1 Tax=Mycoplasmopsis lipofaciens TaxID=114884 RepID=UPI000482DB76|nr:phosphotransferase [Mycoplasmopsis lipofaciens]
MKNSYLIEILKNKLPDLFYKIKNINLVYEGFHNYTFKGKLNDEFVQIRIPKNNIVNYEIEERILKNNKDTIYYQKGVLIKKWFEGKTLDEISINPIIEKNIIKEVKKINKLKLDVPMFDWFYYGKGSKKYQDLVSKYTNDRIVTSHGDLAPKNIIVNSLNEVKIIDFEWVRKCHIIFDIYNLIERVGLNRKTVLKNFKISEAEYHNFQFILNYFSKLTYKNMYAKLLKNLNTSQKILLGNTNENYKYNDYFIQVKKYDGFNHLNKQNKFNNLSCTINCLFEDKKVKISKYVNTNFINFKDKFIMHRIAVALKELHNSKIKVKQNNIWERVKKWYEKHKNKQILSSLNKNIIDQLFSNIQKIQNNVVSHNDFNSTNILMTLNNEIKIVDLEYVTTNNKYFDLAYFCSSIGYNEKEEKLFLSFYSFDLSFKEYLKYKCIVNFYGLLWSIDLDDGFDKTINLLNIQKYKKYLD